MSWIVNGRTYHDYQAYEQARQQSAQQQARAEADAARAEVQRLGARIAQQSRDLDQARGQYAEQVRINDAMRRDVAELGRAQQHLATAQRRAAEQAERQHAEVQVALAGQAEALAAARADHEAHVRAVDHMFEEAHQAMRDGLAQAERRREEGEQRLRGELKELDARFERERQAAMDKAASQGQRTRQYVGFAREALSNLGEDLHRLDLVEDATLSETQCKAAESLLQTGDEASALAIARQADISAHQIGYALIRRHSELEALSLDARRRMDALLGRLATPAVRHMYAAELNALGGVLARLRQDIERSFQRYRAVEVESARIGGLLGRLEELAHHMEMTAPTLVDQDATRRKQAVALTGHLTPTYGRVTRATKRLADPDDIKSSLIYELHFEGARVNLHLGLDGTFSADAYGHASNSDCGQSAMRVMRALQHNVAADAPMVEATNRTGPAAQVQAAAPEWQQVRRAVSRMADNG